MISQLLPDPRPPILMGLYLLASQGKLNILESLEEMAQRKVPVSPISPGTRAFNNFGGYDSHQYCRAYPRFVNGKMEVTSRKLQILFSGVLFSFVHCSLCLHQDILKYLCERRHTENNVCNWQSSQRMQEVLPALKFCLRHEGAQVLRSKRRVEVRKGRDSANLSSLSFGTGMKSFRAVHTLKSADL